MRHYSVAERLKSAQNTYAMLTTFNEIDMSALMAMRTEYKDAFMVGPGASSTLGLESTPVSKVDCEKDMTVLST